MKTSPRASKETLVALAKDRAFLELAAFVPHLSLVRALGVQRDQGVHARLFAVLLDPRRCRSAIALFRELVRYSGIEELIGPSVVSGPWRLAAIREPEARSLGVRALSALGPEVVIALEAQLDGDEGAEQLSLRQDHLSRSFPDARCAILFLTPTGRKSHTQKSVPSVRVVPIGYRDVIRILSIIVATLARERGRDRRVIEELIDHFKEEIVADEEVRAMVREIYARHPEALRLLLRHRPTLEDWKPTYLAELKARQPEITFTYHPSKGTLREIKARPLAWVLADLPLTVMLHADTIEDARPALRLWVSEADYQRRKGALFAWAERAEASGAIVGGCRVDPAFPPVAGWEHWRRALREESHPDHCFVGDLSFGDQAATAAAVRASELVNEVAPTLSPPRSHDGD